jgi:hypothetical protein
MTAWGQGMAARESTISVLQQHEKLGMTKICHNRKKKIFENNNIKLTIILQIKIYSIIPTTKKSQ